MSALAQEFKALYSNDAQLESKVQAATRLLSSLGLGSDGGAAPAIDAEGTAALPPLVRFHYMKGLLEWAITTVSKSSGSGKKGGKPSKDGAAPASPAPQQAGGRLQPEVWRVATALLASSAVPASYQVPAALVPAATALLTQLSAPAGAAAAAVPQPQAGALLAQCAQLLRLLGGKLSAQRPPLEHAVALAEAALLGLQRCAAGSQAAEPRLMQEWAAVAEGAVTILQAAVAAHPVARKVLDGVLPRLLLPLAAAAFPMAADPLGAARGAAAGAADSMQGERLAALCRAVLEAVLFHPAHMPGLAEVCEAAFAAAGTAAGAGGGEEAGGQATGAAPHAHRHYTAQLFQLLSAQLLPQPDAAEQQQPARKRARHEGRKAAAQGPGFSPARPAAGQSLLRLLPWALDRYCSALAKYRRTAETEAALLTQSATAKRRGAQAAAEEGRAAQEGPGAPAAAGALPAAADFQMFAVLLELLLQRAQALGGGAAGGEEAALELAGVVRAIAGLTGPLKSRQVYRPTQDPGGAHRALLERLTNAMLALAAQQTQQGGSVPSVMGAVLQVVQGVLAVEHRPIQSHLPALWGLLLSPQLTPTAAPAGPSGNGGSSSNGATGGAALAVASGLVGAYAELRQLETLLDSLAKALPLAAAGSPAPAAAAAAAAAERVICSEEFLGSLAAAVRGLPSGQAAGIVRWVAARAAQLAEAEPSDPMLPVLTQVCSCCLGSLAVDLTIAPGVAQAVAALVDAMGPALQQLLLVAVEAGRPVGGELLPSLLSLYALALGLHARCAALHPQILPLPGQQIQIRAEDLGGGGEAPAPSLAGGYFAALQPQASRVAAAAPALLPVLRALLPAQQAQQGGGSRRKSKVSSEKAEGGQPGVGAPKGRSEARLALAAVQMAVQRLSVLYERHLYLQYLCPAATIPQQQGAGAAGTEEQEGTGGSQGAAAAERLAQDREAAAVALRQAAEGELVGLSEVVAQVAAAALEASLAASASGSCNGGGGGGGGDDGRGGLPSEESAAREGFAVEALDLVLANAARLQAWVPRESLQAVMQACLRLVASATPAAAAQQGQLPRLRAAALRLLQHPELLEWPGAWSALLGALQCQLYPALRALADSLPQADPAAAPPSSKKAKKKAGSGEVPGGAEPGLGSPAEQLAGHVKRLSRGKGIKPAAWAADLAASQQSISAALAAAAAAASGDTVAAPGSVGKKEKNRKREAAAVAGASGAGVGARGDLPRMGQAAGALQQLLQLVAALPLQHLGSTAAGMVEVEALAHAALATVLGVCEAGARCLPALDASQQEGAVEGLLGALSSGLLLLSKALAFTWLPPASAPPQPPLPLRLVPDWPALLGTLCSAAAALAVAGGGLSAQRPAGHVWKCCGDLMGAATAACLLAPDPETAGLGPFQGWLSGLPQQLSGPSVPQQGQQQPAAVGAAVLAEAALAACHSCLLASAAGGAPAEGGRVASASDIACGPCAGLISLGTAGTSSSSGPAGFSGLQQVLAQSLSRGEGPGLNSSQLASWVQQLQPVLVAAALGAGQAATAAGPAGWLQREALSRVYGGMAHTLRMLCLPYPAADALHAQRRQQQQLQGQAANGGSASGAGSIAAVLGQLLQQAAGLLVGGSRGGGQLGHETTRLVEFLGASCQLTHHTRPAPSAAHFASLLALLLYLLRTPDTSGAGAAVGLALDPVRHTLPFTALFPAACSVGSAEEGAAAGTAGGLQVAAQVRRAALEALRSLVAGCSSQQLGQMLRFVERALPAGPGVAGEQRAGAGAGALPVAELALMLLEASSGGRAVRVLGQHGDRLAGVLAGFLSSAAAAAPAAASSPAAAETGAGAGQAAAGAGQEGSSQPLEAAPLLCTLADAVLAAGAGPAAANGGQSSPSAGGGAAALVATAAAPQEPQQAADPATLCTVVRALESLAGRPKVFPLSGRHVSNMVHGVAVTWAACRAWPAGSSGTAAAGRALSVSAGAALFTGSCALLLAILRHRQEELGRCLPLLLQAARALLAWLVSAEVASKLAPGQPGDVPAWRVKCGEALARVLAEVAALKAATSRYCPHLLADYLVLAASPLTPKAQAMLGLDLLEAGEAPPPAGRQHGGSSGGRGAGEEEEELLAGGLLCAETAAALRQGACAVYGACSASELQYLYASLGQRGGAVWRAALAALKTHYEQHYKYTGKV